VWPKAVVIVLTSFTEPVERDVLLLIYLFIYLFVDCYALFNNVLVSSKSVATNVNE